MILMEVQKKKVAVVGAGITGLAAAYYMQKEIKEKGLPIELYLIESSLRLGGQIQTVRRDGFVIERGPDSFLSRKVSMAKLAKEVGLEDQMVRNATGQSYVLVNEQLHPIPGGSIMGIPTEIAPFIKTELFSWSGKIRAAGDFVIGRSGIKEDQSLGQFFRRRFGKEVVENLVEPLLSGIFSGDIDRLSLHATYPQFYEVEREHRSLMLGMKKTKPKTTTPQSASAKREGIFLTFRNGLESLVEAIEENLDVCNVMKGVKVENIERVEDKAILSLSNGKTLDCDGVILATPHHISRQLFEKHGILQSLKDIPLASVATVAMAFPKACVTQEKEGTGFLVSRNGDYSITACTWVNKKWPTTTPEDKVLLRSFVGRSGDEAVVELSDSEIEQIVLTDLRKVSKIEGNPLFTVVTRYKEARPQYVVGHKVRVEKAKNELQEQFPMIKIAGSAYEGAGLPDCIDQGVNAMHAVLANLKLS